jgi:hypothetical protein
VDVDRQVESARRDVPNAVEADDPGGGSAAPVAQVVLAEERGLGDRVDAAVVVELRVRLRHAVGEAAVSGTDVDDRESLALREAELALQERDLVHRLQQVAAHAAVSRIGVGPAAEGGVLVEPVEQPELVALAHGAHEEEVLQLRDARELAVVPGDERLAAEVPQVEEGVDRLPLPSRPVRGR